MAPPACPAPDLRPWRLLVAALLFALTFPRMAQRGMFGDGLLYATVARNLSRGMGSFWSPTYTPITWPRFVEHPPLGLELEAASFRLLGDHLWVERLHSMVLFALQALAIAALWRRLEPEAAGHDWLPLVFWVLPPMVTWSAVNNMLENTQALWTSVAVLLLVAAAQATRAAVAGVAAAAAGAAIVAAVLTKGPVGLFPLAVPIISCFLPEDRRSRRWWLPLACMSVALSAAGLALATCEPSRQALADYAHAQLLPSLAGEREASADPFAAARHLGASVIGRMSILAAVAWLAGRGEARLRWRRAAWPFAIGLSASLPIVPSPKLMGHYFVPAVPFYALGFASLTLGAIEVWTARHGARSRAVLLALAGALVAAAVLVPIVRGPIEPRDLGLLADLDRLAPRLPRDTIIGACPESRTDWRLQSYLGRLYRVWLEPGGAPVRGWMLTDGTKCQAGAPCRAIAKGGDLTLLRCRPAGRARRPSFSTTP